MSRFFTGRLVAILSVAFLLFSGTAHAAVIVDVSDSTGGWNGFMNVFDASTTMPCDGAYQFGSGWGLPDLNSDFDDANSKLTLSPNTIGDPDPYWYVGGGMPGAQGNKCMEANLFGNFPNGSPELTALQADGTLVFNGNVLMNTFTAAHMAEIFIKEFTPDYATLNETAIALSPGAFSLTHALTGLGGEVQYGFRVKGENVWAGDEGPFGNAMIATVPEPTGLALIGIAGMGLFCLRRKR